MELSKIILLFWTTIVLACLTKGARKKVKTVGFKKQFNTWAVSKNCNFNGNDLQWYWHKINTFEDCLKTCEWYGNACTHFVWRGSDQVCFLKTGRVQFQDAYPDYREDHSCAIRCGEIQTEECRSLLANGDWKVKFYPGPPAKFLRSSGCFFRDTPQFTAFFNTSSDECAEECRRHPTCTHFNFKLGYCDMLQGTVDEDDVFECEIDRGCDCGIDCHSAHYSEVCVQQSGQYEWQVRPEVTLPIEQTYPKYIQADDTKYNSREKSAVAYAPTKEIRPLPLARYDQQQQHQEQQQLQQQQQPDNTKFNSREKSAAAYIPTQEVRPLPIGRK